LSKIDGRGGTALDAHLLFFGAARDAGEGALDQEGGELLAADLGEDVNRSALPPLVIHIFWPLRM
jgi:hypothetical protein